MRVLVVEDEPGIATGLRRALEAEGFGVDVCHDGTDGLAAARSGDHDLLIVDIMLPGTNGYVICRELRAEDMWTPILLLTAKAGEFDEAEGLDTGADDYLTKPFSMVVLVARVHALLRRSRSSGPTSIPFAVGDLRVDPSQHRCWRGDQEVTLTPRELTVLEQLLAKAPATVTKDELLANVWGRDFAGNPNIVEVYVGHLRRKIDAPFRRASIETVRGVGYRVADDR